MQNDLSYHLARTIDDDRLRAARRHPRPAVQAEPLEERAGRARHHRPLLVRTRILLARLR